MATPRRLAQVSPHAKPLPDVHDPTYCRLISPLTHGAVRLLVTIDIDRDGRPCRAAPVTLPMIRAHVIPMSEGWCVRVLGETLAVEPTELAAEQAAHAHLMKNGGGELVVHTAAHGQARRRVYEPPA